MYYELEDITAKNLEDMEMFVKMNPYVVIDQIITKDEGSSNIMREGGESNFTQGTTTWRTETSQGKTNLFWKIGLIFRHSLSVSLYDKDIKLDDFIGQGRLELEQVRKEF